MNYKTQEFPSQLFDDIVVKRRDTKKQQETAKATIAERTKDITRVTATLIPAPRLLLERKIAELEKIVSELISKLEAVSCDPKPSTVRNKENIPIDTVLRGESNGKKYTLEVLAEGYLCSDGNIYQSLSGAALGVSGNRRSGWRFWKNVEDRSIGEIIGRFSADGTTSPFGMP